jgi:hypothetical protein
MAGKGLIQAEARDGKVVITMSTRQAKLLEEELLWCRDSDTHSIRLYEALAEMSERTGTQA